MAVATFIGGVTAVYAAASLHFFFETISRVQSYYSSSDDNMALEQKEATLSGASFAAVTMGFAIWCDQNKWVELGNAVAPFNLISNFLYIITSAVKLVDALEDYDAALLRIVAAETEQEEKDEADYKNLALLRIAFNVSSIAFSVLGITALAGAIATDSLLILGSLSLYVLFAACAFLLKRKVEARDGIRALAYG